MDNGIESILITGGAGFIGRKTAHRLLQLGYKVRIMDNLLNQIHGSSIMHNQDLKDLNNDAEIIVGDVLNADLWRKILPNTDAILHLAALTGTGQSMYETYNYSNVNIGGTSVLLDLLPTFRNRIKKLVVASSRSIYGEGKYKVDSTSEVYYPETRDQALLSKGIFEFFDKQGNKLSPLPTDEQTPPNPLSTYAITKYAQEKLILNTCAALGVDAVALRYQNVYGPGQSLKNPYTGIVSIFSTAILRDQEINVFEDGLATRDFVYVDDVVEANVRSLDLPELKNTVINVGTGIPVSILQVVDTLGKLLNKSPKYRVSGDFRAGDIRHNYADITRMGHLLGLSPLLTFDQGMKKFVQWLSLNLKELSSRQAYEQSLLEMREKGLMGGPKK